VLRLALQVIAKQEANVAALFQKMILADRLPDSQRA